MSGIDIRKLESRHRAHPFDFAVKCSGPTHGVDASPNAIGGFYGIGWDEVFRDHQTGDLYSVSCSDGVNGGKNAHSDRDMAWMEQVRLHIIARTTSVSRGPIHISQREWAIMLGFTFCEWLDELPGERYKTTGDNSRHMMEGEIGTIGGIDVIVDPTATDDLPPVGNFRGFDPNIRPSGTIKGGPVHKATKFEGVFADALKRALAKTG
ncbi:MAG: hypothetical protein HQ488_00910 [Parcubacteria group bacterium]|nr:hypothetical protein [Parcubacteria group bacterium]